MNLSASLGAGGPGGLAVLCEDGERVLCRGWHDEGDGDRTAALAVLPTSEHRQTILELQCEPPHVIVESRWEDVNGRYDS